jgi:hypothetical protein
MVGNLGGRLLELTGLGFHHQNPGDHLVALFLAVLAGRENVSLGNNPLNRMAAVSNGTVHSRNRTDLSSGSAHNELSFSSAKNTLMFNKVLQIFY